MSAKSLTPSANDSSGPQKSARASRKRLPCLTLPALDSGEYTIEILGKLSAPVHPRAQWLNAHPLFCIKGTAVRHDRIRNHGANPAQSAGRRLRSPFRTGRSAASHGSIVAQWSRIAANCVERRLTTWAIHARKSLGPHDGLASAKRRSWGGENAFRTGKITDGGRQSAPHLILSHAQASTTGSNVSTWPPHSGGPHD